MTLLEGIKNKETDGKTLASLAASQVNTFAPQTQFYNEVMFEGDTEEEFVKMSAAFVKSLATSYQKNLYDGRNEIACRTADALVRCQTVKSVLSKSDWEGDIMYTCPSLLRLAKRAGKEIERDGIFAYYMSNEHRTLQQSFAELAFRAIHDSLSKEDQEETAQYLEATIERRYWTNLPLI